MENNTQPIPEVTPAPSPIPPSEFKGTTLQLIGWQLLGTLLSILTIGIGAPWAQCMIYRWETKHTYVNGKQLHFDGKGHQLLGKYLLWGLLILVTLGIYSLFIPVQMSKWRASHTRFAVPSDESADTLSGAMIFGIVMACIAALLLIALVITLLAPKLVPQSNKPNDEFSDFFSGAQSDDESTFPFGGDVYTYIIDNGDGTFSIIYGNPDDPSGAQPDNSGTSSTTQSSNNAQSQYSFTDDPRIIDGWLMRAVMQISDSHSELEAAELNLQADGTFSYSKDLFSRSNETWRPDGIAESYSRGTYTFYDGVLTLHYTEYFSQPYSSEPGTWKPTDRTVTQNITFTENDHAIYFSSFSDVMNHNGYFEPIYYCPRIDGSISATLSAIYPNGIN